ncbi:MAG TPA: putative porin, partial [Rhodopila sp.]
MSAHRRMVPLAVSLCALLCTSSAFAQSATVPDTAQPNRQETRKPTVLQTSPTSPNTTVNLLHLMVKRKLLTEDEAQGLIKQAEDESYVSRQAAKDAT